MKQLLIGLICIICLGSCKSKIYTIVEHNPEYPGGQAAFFKYLSQTINYPTILRENGIDCSTTYVQFIVEKSGEISHPTIKKGCKENEYTQQLIQIFKNMPRWKPGYQNEKPVRVAYTVPIQIHLE